MPRRYIDVPALIPVVVDMKAASARFVKQGLVIHMGHPHLVIEPLARRPPATIGVLRWRPR